MAGELGVGVEDTVGGGVVACSVHGIRAGLVEGCLYKQAPLAKTLYTQVPLA